MQSVGIPTYGDRSGTRQSNNALAAAAVAAATVVAAAVVAGFLHPFMPVIWPAILLKLGEIRLVFGNKAVAGVHNKKCRSKAYTSNSSPILKALLFPLNCVQ